MMKEWLVIILVLSYAPIVGGKQAIPGLYGWGADTRHAYNGSDTPDICIVTSLGAGTGSPGISTRNGIDVRVGTLGQCIDYDDAGFGKFILFETSGTINGGPSYRYRIDSPNVFIAGQTAPSPGVTIRNAVFVVRDTHDVVIQHLRIRVGDALPGYDPENRDGMVILSTKPEGSVHEIVVDHCSVSWGVDETLTIYEIDGAAHNVTVANTIVSEGLRGSLHPEGNHSKGLMVGRGVENVTLLGNLMAHSRDRNPLLQGISVNVVNNAVYNAQEGWGPTMVAPWQTHAYRVDYVGNVIIKGPQSQSDVGVFLSGPVNERATWYTDFASTSRLFLSDNICFNGSHDYSAPASPDGDCLEDLHGDLGNTIQSTAVTWPAGLVAAASVSVRQHIASSVGARPADRDAVDTRTVEQLVLGTGGTIIDSVQYDTNDCTDANTPIWCCTGLNQGTCQRNAENGWPVLEVRNQPLSLPGNPHQDSGNGYTNLEVWLQRLAAALEGRTGGPEIARVRPSVGARFPAGTTHTTISVNSSDAIECRADAADMPYSSMSWKLTRSDDNFSLTYEPMGDDSNYSVYGSCTDGVEETDFMWTFGVLAGGDGSIVVDDTSPGYSEPVGLWADGGLPSGFYGLGYRQNGADSDLDTARFTPTIVREGIYSVYLWWPQWPTRSPSVKVTIEHAGGTSTTTIDQTANGGYWHLIGTYTFDTGTGGHVQVGGEGSMGDQFGIEADAALFQPDFASLADGEGDDGGDPMRDGGDPMDDREAGDSRSHDSSEVDDVPERIDVTGGCRCSSVHCTHLLLVTGLVLVTVRRRSRR